MSDRIRCRMGMLHSMEAELWALRDGLAMAKSMYLVPLEEEVDAKSIIQWIIGKEEPRHKFNNLVRDTGS